MANPWHNYVTLFLFTETRSTWQKIFSGYSYNFWDQRLKSNLLSLLIFFTISNPSTSHKLDGNSLSLWKIKGVFDCYFCLPKQDVTSPLIVVRIAPSPMLDTTPLLPSSLDKSNTLTPHHSNYNPKAVDPAISHFWN